MFRYLSFFFFWREKIKKETEEETKTDDEKLTNHFLTQGAYRG